MAIKVHITLRVVIDGKSTFRQAVQGANSRLEPLTTIFRGRKQTHTEGTYYLQWTENGKGCWLRVGSDPAMAVSISPSKPE